MQVSILDAIALPRFGSLSVTDFGVGAPAFMSHLEWALAAKWRRTEKLNVGASLHVGDKGVSLDDMHDITNVFMSASLPVDLQPHAPRIGGQATHC